MPFRPKQIEHLLQSKFHFIVAANHEPTHTWLQFRIDGLPTIVTRVEHHKGDIRDQLASLMAKQLHVRNPFFNEMFSCTKDAVAYVNQLKTDPFPPFPPLRR